MILSSPLTRALQTCLISLKDHPTAKSKGVTLCRDLREIKTLGGFDAKGKCFGPAIMTRTEEKLIKKIKEANTLGDVSENQVKRYLEMAKEACKTKIDYNDANTQWWVLKDTKSDVKERLEDFLSYIRYCPGNTFICVGHSMFLKALFTHCLSKEWSARHPQVAQNLKTEKLTNAGCVAADFTFRGSSKEWEITEAKLLFETGFQFRRTRSHSPGGSRSPRNGKRSERLLSDGSEALALSGRRKPAGGGGVSRNVSSTRSSPLPEDESKHR
uniref:Uncharacterized protein n=2 Tax=Lotharella globosa TaxID=91324 RepID=A0A7S3YWL0_9EUKA